jgi:formylglycine-generating enzyme required for sulfatase activity
VAEESSRKTGLPVPLAPGGCPRCGTRLGQPYKYCPNCAYRLRPDLVPAPHVSVAGAPLSQRLVALGGYLLFAAMLLLVVFAGVRLFSRPAPPDLVQPQVMRTRDGGSLPLTLDEFVDVPSGIAFWGLYDPGREDVVARRAEAAGEERKEAEQVVGALAEIADDTAKAEDVAEARGLLQQALDRHPSVREALRQWAEAFDAPLPQDPVTGIPDAYEVEDSFRMSRREVTNDQYFEFLRAWARKSGAPVPPHLVPAKWTRKTGSRDVPRIYKDGEGDFPVVGIPFDAALEFCGWFWEERLGADPDLVVDLPTWKEFVLAARGDELTYNYPWGRTFEECAKPPNLGNPRLKSVVEEREEEFHNGFLDLVGNAAEWVYWRDEKHIHAVGWSYEDAWVWKVHEGEPGQPGRIATPFSAEGFRVVTTWEEQRDVGFRPVIRRAPQLPSFVPVTAGPVRHRPCPDGLLPPERPDPEPADEAEGTEPETIEQIRARRERPVSFATETEQVERGFDISATEITNRQYLAFLKAIAPGHTKERLKAFLPKGWRRHNLWVRREPRVQERGGVEEEPGRLVARAYDGYYVPWDMLETLYAAGEENVPVQGITIDQAEEYATWLSGRLGRRCSIPTVAQYLRAARGDGTAPYPWGDDRTDPELTPSYRPEIDPRAFSLSASPTRPIVGLAGNVAELVRDDGGRLLLAGGFYHLPARLATLDCFLDAGWDTVQFVVEPEDEADEGSGPLSAARTLAYFTGFRIVRLPDPF